MLHIYCKISITVFFTKSNILAQILHIAVKKIMQKYFITLAHGTLVQVQYEYEHNISYSGNSTVTPEVQNNF